MPEPKCASAFRPKPYTTLYPVSQPEFCFPPLRGDRWQSLHHRHARRQAGGLKQLIELGIARKGTHGNLKAAIAPREHRYEVKWYETQEDPQVLRNRFPRVRQCRGCSCKGTVNRTKSADRNRRSRRADKGASPVLAIDVVVQVCGRGRRSHGRTSMPSRSERPG